MNPKQFKLEIESITAEKDRMELVFTSILCRRIFYIFFCSNNSWKTAFHTIQMVNDGWNSCNRMLKVRKYEIVAL